MARVRVGHNSGSNQPKDVISPAKRGYNFQFDLTRRIIEKLSGYRTVTFRSMKRDIVTRDNLERVGRDGGIDLIIEIEAKNKKAALQVAGRVKKVLKSLG